MKKRTIIGIAAMAVAAAICVGVGLWNDKPAQPGPGGNEGIYNPGTYTASAQGLYGPVTVNLTVDANNITDVTIEAPDETPTLGGAAAEQMAAAVKETGSIEVDGLAGATITSDAVKTALADALAQALIGGSSAGETGAYTPGTYTASAQGLNGPVTVNLTVDANNITDVTIDASGETPALGGAAAEQMAAAVKESGSIEVDGLAGATITSDAIKTALADCLAQAKGEATPGGDETAKPTVADGTYTGKAPSFGVMKEMELEVTFKDGKITAINTLCAGSATQADEDEYSPIYATVADRLYPRIIESQSLAVDSIAGATVSSSSAKRIIAAIIDANGGNSADWYTPIEKSTNVVTLEGYDVIVVGLGSSGVATYLSAAQNGASVFGIETAAKIGGNGTNTAGPLGVNPDKQVAANGGNLFVDPDELLKAWMEYTENDAKEELVRLFIAESGKTFGWLEENYDFAFLPMMFAFYDSHGWPLWTMYNDSTGTSKDLAYVNSMAKALTGKNDYMTELTATDLIVENGEVVGVEAKYYDGTTYKIYGKNVVLADGGYIGDAEMCQKYTGAVWKTKGMTQCNGFGIKEALELGGALYNPDVAVEDHIAQVDNIIRSDDISNDDKGILTSLVLDLNYQLIDSKGDSFDANYNGLGISFNAWEAGSNYYVLINEQEYNDIKTKGLISFNAPMFFNQGGTYTEGTPVSNLDDIMAMGQEYGNVIIADSLSDLSAKLGFTVNLSDVHGQTEGKIYCIKGAAYVYSTCGGLDVDTNMNLLKEDGTPIKNVYVVGNNSLGVLNKSNKAYVTYGGAAQGWALTSGRLVGEIITGKRTETSAPEPTPAPETTPAPVATPKPETTPAPTATPKPEPTPAPTPAPTPTPEAGKYNPGSYTGSSFGMGDLTVTVTVDANNITAVKIDAPGETPDIGGKALPTLEANAVAKGAGMDGVAGATITSDAVREAVAEALKKAAR